MTKFNEAGSETVREKKKEKERGWGWASKVLNPNTIKACLSKTWLSFIPQLSSDPLLCCLLLQSLSAARLPCVFLIYPLLYKPPTTPYKAPFLWSCPVLGPLCHGNPLFLLLPIINAHARDHRWSEWVYLSSLGSSILLLECGKAKNMLYKR